MGVGRTYGFAYVVQPRFHDPLEGRLERLRNRFATFGGRVQEYLASLERDDEVICSAMEWMEFEKWHTGRVVLVGDAAHASSPMMGQGGCMAMEDACTLADELRAAVAVESALASYVSRRKPRVRWVQQESMALAEILTSSSAPRNAALRERGKEAMQARFGPLVPAPEHDQTTLGMCRAEMFDTWSLESTKSGHRVRAFGDCRMDWRAKSYIVQWLPTIDEEGQYCFAVAL